MDERTMLALTPSRGFSFLSKYSHHFHHRAERRPSGRSRSVGGALSEVKDAVEL